ncbi:MAG: GAF domain-containing protein [Proteobacteria bacterium]|nr:GAF domain-containing protein [Pseudomonadota bacterium]
MSSEPSAPVVEPAPDARPSVEGTAAKIAARERQQEILAELGVLALRGTPLPELLDETTRLAAEGLESEFCKILEYLPDVNRLIMRAGVGWPEGTVGQATLGADLESPSGYALRTGKPVISNQLENEERFRTPELLAANNIRRAINVILQGDGKPYGVLEVDSTSEQDFSEKDIAFLQGSANIIGMAIERQRREINLQSALEYQQVLVKEINHRVKNSLQLVSSMLNLRAKSQEDPAVSQILSETSARVGAISRAHDRLYRSSDVKRLELSAYLSEVCRDLEEAIPQCRVSFEAPSPAYMTTDRAIQVAILLTELVTNAAKHAYAKGGGRVWVSLKPIDRNSVSLSIRDEGVGLPAGFKVDGFRGLGMRLVSILSEQMGAEIQIERLPQGTEFSMVAHLDPEPDN